MKPFYFGSATKPLLGIYHPPHGVGCLTRGVVLCYPMGAEYMRAHRAFRHLTRLLSRRGIHVIRFDYFGTGDSAGRGDEATVEQWLEDTGLAIDELKATTGIAAVSLVGLRFGGTLAAIVSARRRDIDRIVLWDPVVHGATHVARLLAPARLKTAAGAPGGADEIPPWQPPRRAGTVGVEGFALTERMRDAIGNIDLASRTHFGGRMLHLVVSREELHYFRLRDRWRTLGLPFRYRCIPDAEPVSQEGDVPPDELGAGWLPQEALRGIVACLT
jgi:pimeloyl-ACP methyl ester carboxylesterase